MLVSDTGIAVLYLPRNERLLRGDNGDVKLEWTQNMNLLQFDTWVIEFVVGAPHCNAIPLQSRHHWPYMFKQCMQTKSDWPQCKFATTAPKKSP